MQRYFPTFSEDKPFLGKSSINVRDEITPAKVDSPWCNSLTPLLQWVRGETSALSHAAYCRSIYRAGAMTFFVSFGALQSAIQVTSNMACYQPIARIRDSEPRLGVPFAHALRAAAATLDGSEDPINVCSTTPLLVCQYIDSKLLLSSLD